MCLIKSLIRSKVNKIANKVYDMETKSGKTKVKKVCTGALAGKYNCSRAYVNQVLNKGGKSILARKIILDANDIRQILDRETIITI